MCASVAWSFGYRRVGVQTAVLAMGIGEGGRAGIAIDDADAGESGDVRLRLLPNGI
jgi:hypothetical protein